jgi:uncharacterized protein (DUF433 family)
LVTARRCGGRTYELERRIDYLRQRHGIGKTSSTRGVIGNRERVAGTQISTRTVERLLEAGWTDARILEEYPDLRSGDLRAARARRAG